MEDRLVLQWVAKASQPLTDLHDPILARDVLEALRRKISARRGSELVGDRLETDTGSADGGPQDRTQQQGARACLAQLRELQ